MSRIEAIDIGTVSVRMGIGDVDDGLLRTFTKKTEICDLGQGVAASGALDKRAVERVLRCVDGYLRCFTRNECDAITCTLTQVAREAEGADELVAALRKRGLEPDIISGRDEGELCAMGAAADFVERPLVVCDVGGGSTEVCLWDVEGAQWTHSIALGCRRVTDRFLARTDPPSAEDVEEARVWCRETLRENLGEELLDGRLRKAPMVVSGGTVTTIAAMVQELAHYNPAVVQGMKVSARKVSRIVDDLASMRVEERARVVGIQPHRAPVMVGGAVVIEALMAVLGKDSLMASDSDSLQGVVVCADLALESKPVPVSWEPRLSLNVR